jgi:hypothetical protein
MYSAVPAPLREFLLSASAEAPTGPQPMILNYPVTESSTLFYHSLALHELGHGLEAHREFFRMVKDEAPVDEHPGFEEAVSEAVKLRGTSPHVMRQRIRELANAWLIETSCDAIGLLYGGPTYLLAFAAFLLRWKDDRATEKHPPTRLRLQLLLDASTRDPSWSPLWKRGLPQINEWLDGLSQRRLLRTVPFDFVGDYVVSTAPRARDRLKNHLDTDACSADDHLSQVERAMELLKNRVIPAEDAGGSIDARAIITAGWLNRMPGDPEPRDLVEPVRDVSYQRFLAKAIELSAVASNWSEASEGVSAPQPE